MSERGARAWRGETRRIFAADAVPRERTSAARETIAARAALDSFRLTSRAVVIVSSESKRPSRKRATSPSLQRLRRPTAMPPTAPAMPSSAA